MRVLIAGGGTGGHIIPALAIAQNLRQEHGAEVRFLGTARGLESKLVPEAGFPLDLIRVGQLNQVSLATRVRTLSDLPLGMLRCVALLRQFRPDVVVGVGGYASGPGMAAAILLRIPTLAFESNAIPGLANRLIGWRVDVAAVNFAETQKYFRRAVVTGVPVRPEFFSVQRKSAGPLRLLVFGGSQGAQILNRIVPLAARALLDEFPGLQIVHQAGGRHAETTRAAYGGLERVRVLPYLDAMVEEVAAADLLVCRSGASTVAELAAASKASVLVPFAAAADDHQRKNAEALVQAGGALMILERDLSADTLATHIRILLGDEGTRARMGQSARKLAHEDATARIVEICVELGRGRRAS